MRYVPEKAMYLFILGFMSLALSGCGSGGGGNNSDASSSEGQIATYDMNMYPLNKLVCDPFDPGGDLPDEFGGLKAELYYLQPGQAPFTNVQNFFDHGYKSDQILFFSQLNVPTRLFDQGFALETGGVVEDDDGNTLVENFALKFSTVLRLGPNDPAGYYQIAVLSDDGSKVRVRSDGQWVEFINNDGNTPTRMGCGNNALYFDQNTEYLIEIDYYQGPRYHIALSLIWRPVSAENAAKDTQCGKYGNKMYFDYDNNSAPQAAYNGLLVRGWKPMAKENFELPVGTMINPCTMGDVPTITEFKITELTGRSISLSWKTDIPATSQILYSDVNTKKGGLTASDNVLRTVHSVTLSNLASSVFMVQAVSISDSFGKAVSAPITVSLE